MELDFLVVLYHIVGMVILSLLTICFDICSSVLNNLIFYYNELHYFENLLRVSMAASMIARKKRDYNDKDGRTPPI